MSAIEGYMSLLEYEKKNNKHLNYLREMSQSDPAVFGRLTTSQPMSALFGLRERRFSAPLRRQEKSD